MLKMLTEYIAGSVVPNPQQVLKIKYLKVKSLLKLVIALTCASIIAAEYFLILVALRYLTENLGFSYDIASLVISLFLLLQALFLFSYLSYKLNNIEDLCENQSGLKKIMSAFMSGFENNS